MKPTPSLHSITSHEGNGIAAAHRRGVSSYILAASLSLSLHCRRRIRFWEKKKNKKKGDRHIAHSYISRSNAQRRFTTQIASFLFFILLEKIQKWAETADTHWTSIRRDVLRITRHRLINDDDVVTLNDNGKKRSRCNCCVQSVSRELRRTRRGFCR